jgi:hypothetical protein
MAIKQLQDFKIFDGDLNADRWSTLYIYGCENDKFRDMFLERIEKENIKNKEKLRELLGGKKVYTIVNSIKNDINGDAIYDIIKDAFQYEDIKMKLGNGRWWIENKRYQNVIVELGRLINISRCAREHDASENEVIEILKKEYYYIEDIVKMRNVPKETRLFRMIFDGILKRHNIEGNYEPQLAKIMDILGRKPKTYILELSTDAIDILTCSVTDNFTSCFNIRSGGCNMASTNYMAIDRTTAVLKLYEYNDKNVASMENGVINYNGAVARVFVSFDVDDNKRMVIGRLYPDNKILNYDSLKEILLPLLKCKDTSKGEWVNDMLINYGHNFVGYADYNESWNVGYMATPNCKRINVADMGMVYYNNIIGDFDTSSNYKLQSGTMWQLTTHSEWKLRASYEVKVATPEKEECETTINGTYDTVSFGEMLTARILNNLDDSPFYTIPDNQRISISGITINDTYEDNA